MSYTCFNGCFLRLVHFKPLYPYTRIRFSVKHDTGKCNLVFIGELQLCMIFRRLKHYHHQRMHLSQQLNKRKIGSLFTWNTHVQKANIDAYNMFAKFNSIFIVSRSSFVHNNTSQRRYQKLQIRLMCLSQMILQQAECFPNFNAQINYTRYREFPNFWCCTTCINREPHITALFDCTLWLDQKLPTYCYCALCFD